MDWELHLGGSVKILCCEESEAVRIAARNLAGDIGKVFSGDIDVGIECSVDVEQCRGSVGTIVIRREELGKKEAYSHRVEGGVLYIGGQDRRGMIYGIYELSRWLGVSPWYYFADVPVKKRDSAILPDGYHYSDYPSVEYRGIFINDEEELDKWVRLHLGEETIGVKAYEKIFELLLRLRANYIWPAMHVNSFNVKRENGELADRMGIVVGTSHCDMLMRSNNREWYPWLEKKGYTDVEYDYSIQGRNREVLNEYWRESVEQNKDFEVGYTLGMRGIHDSGFETKSLKGLEGEALRNAKIELLQTVIAAQEQILSETLDNEPLKSFVPYKEVLELYDNGLEVPEDLTLIWTNDNYGYIRRYPGEKEKKRKGGNGIYYHNSYWAAPGMSYLFINSIPLAHTRNELYKAWCEDIRKVWVLNVGAIKPLEQEISFYLNFAWEVGKENSPRRTDDVDEYLKLWINETFSGGHGKKMARILNDFSQLTNVRKIELMDSDVFSQTAYGDEAAVRIKRYRELVGEADKVYEELPENEKDAFFQICLMKIHAAYYTNSMFYYADRSVLCTKQGKAQAAYKYANLSRQYDDKRRKLILYYNNIMSDGKWSGILTPEDFPPPRTATLPACVVPLTPLDEIEKKLVVTLWNDEDSLTFVDGKTKWFELANAGEGTLDVRVELPAWFEVAHDVENNRKINRAVGLENAKDYKDTVHNVNYNVIVSEAVNLGNIKKYTDSIHNKALDMYNSDAYNNEIDTYKTVLNVGAESRIMIRPSQNMLEMWEDSQNTNLEQTGGIEADNGKVYINDGKDIVKGVIKLTCDETCQTVEIPVSVDLKGMSISCEKKLSVEDGGVVVLEADSVADELEGTGWHYVKRLGRDHGGLIEADADGGAGAAFHFYMASDAQTPLLELHRFPSLNSTGRIRAEISVDGGDRILIESKSNDEWRGTWKQNVFDNVDKLTVAVPRLNSGEHTVRIYPVDKYFAFSRMVIYTKERKDSMFGGLFEDYSDNCADMSVENEQCHAEVKAFSTDGKNEKLSFGSSVYGHCESAVAQSLYEKLTLKPRPMLVAGVTPGSNTLPDTNTAIEWDYEAGQQNYKITAKQIIAQADSPFAETDGAIKLDMAVALADNDNAYMKGQWEYCLSESYNRSGLAMYIRKPGLKFDDEKPSLHYKISCGGGMYSLWLLMKNESYDGAELIADIDGKVLEKSEIAGGERIGNYCGERVYRWIRLWQQPLTAGTHEIGIYTPSSANRFDRIYITKGEEYPPADSEWIKEEENE